MILTATDSSAGQPDDPSQPAGEADSLDYIEYFGDGEWYAVLMDGSNPVGSGYGDSPEAARRSLFGRAELD